MEQTVGTLTGSAIGIALIALVGLVVGLLARLLVPGPDPAGIVLTIALGIGGAFLGGLVGAALGWQAGGFVLSILGAMALVWLRRALRRPPAP